MQVSFVPSLFVGIRKRMGQEVFEVFHRAIVDAVERERTKSKASRSDEPDDQDPPPSRTENSDRDKKPTHQGKLILGATVAEQAIRILPTLARSTRPASSASKSLIGFTPNRQPRSYRQQAR